MNAESHASIECDLMTMTLDVDQQQQQLFWCEQKIARFQRDTQMAKWQAS